MLATGVKEGGGGGFEEYGGDLTLHGMDFSSAGTHCQTLGRCVPFVSRACSGVGGKKRPLALHPLLPNLSPL